MATTQVLNNGLAPGADPALGLQGVAASDNSTVFITDSTISGNGGSGVHIGRSSTGRIGRSQAGVAGPNTIDGNGGSGVIVFRTSHALIDGNTITNNLDSGINVELGSSATIIGNKIWSNHSRGINVTNAAGARIGLDDRNTDPRRADCSCTNTIRLNTLEGISVSNGGEREPPRQPDPAEHPPGGKHRPRDGQTTGNGFGVSPTGFGIHCSASFFTGNSSGATGNATDTSPAPLNRGNCP